ncbi:MAG TPA: DUF6505 family protein [Beijerinckiaceae bacterium]|nr:DUF6505 family protein [Beijerinckiaceae bacterium]
MKLIRTIRLDPSDTFVFTRSAEPGEWAVSGAFVFWNQPLEGLVGKERAAFRSGLLGIASLGWSTLAVVSEATAAERAGAVDQLARQLVARFGAPDLATARAAAEQEIDYAEQLAEPPVGTLIAVRRSDENGDIRERFRTLLPGGDDLHNRAFHFEMSDEEPEERVDLMALDNASNPQGRA